jgi:hypothetical protein
MWRPFSNVLPQNFNGWSHQERRYLEGNQGSLRSIAHASPTGSWMLSHVSYP